MDSDSDKEKCYVSEDTEDEEPCPPSISQPPTPDFSASSSEFEDDVGNAAGQQPQPCLWTLPPQSRRRVVYTFTGAPNGKSREAAQVTSESTPLSVLLLFFVEIINLLVVETNPSSWGLHLIVVRRFEYTEDPKSYTSGSVATGRTSHAGKVEE